MRMRGIFFIATLFLLLPAGAFAASVPASFGAERSLLIASTSAGNAYVAGFSVVLTAPVLSDFSVLGGSVVTAAPITGDGLFIGGSVNSRAAIGGDLRAVGGSIDVAEPVAGDLAAFGFSVRDTGRVRGNVFIIAANAAVLNGASGPVTIYGNDVSLDGEFADNVEVIASGRLTLAASTTIRGTLSYQAPDTADIPSSARIIGGVKYTSVSYLPSSDTSHILELMSIGLFLFVRIFGALLLAGLLAGLFPKLAQQVVDSAYTGRPRDWLLTTLLGFAILVATPILLLLLLLTFVGVGLALLLFLLYALIVLLAFVYAGILLGGACVRRFRRREVVLWRDGVLGMLALSLIALVPFVGPLILLLLTTFSAGALLSIFFRYAFPHDEHTSKRA